MKERPILFSAPMVRALLYGRKTQTRRVVKDKHLPWVENMSSKFFNGEWDKRPMPYGRPGDRLWVRETWARDDEDGDLLYRADVGLRGDADDWERNRLDGAPRYRWRPSIHIPRWASRITLEVTGVRVERLQEISEADCAKEGAPFSYSGFSPEDAPDWRGWYRDLWESINGPGSWDANPWVWVVEFKRLEETT